MDGRDDAIDESLKGIEDKQETEQPEDLTITEGNVEDIRVERDSDVPEGQGLAIAAEAEHNANPNHPVRHKIAQFIKSGWGKALILLVLVVGGILAVPMTRYAALGFFIKKPAVITVVDDTTGKPVSDAIVHFARVDGKTDKQGMVTLNDMSVGDHPLSVEKNYYTTVETSYTVPIFGDAATTVRLKATGRLAVITVKNAISGKGVSGASVKIGDTSAVTDDSGVANIALAIRDADQPGTVTLDGYTSVDISVSTKDVSPTVDVQLVPSGKVYFISNRNGTYDIMSSNLDGTGQEVVIKGTGREVPYELQLATSPDHAALAYVARRDSGVALYAVDTAAKTLTKIDGNSTSYNFVGWAGDTFYYTTYTDLNPVTAGRAKLMSYSQSTKKTSQLDSSQLATDNSNTLEQSFSQVQLTGGRLYYARCWQSTIYGVPSITQKASMVTVINGKVATLKSVDQTKPAYCSAVVKKPNTLYFDIVNTYNGSDTQYFRYTVGGSMENVQLSEADFMSQVMYYTSPDGIKTFWTETVDSKPVSYVGDANGGNARKTGGGDEFRAYGWFNDSYVLFSKNNNELYIMSADGQGDMHKIADYSSSGNMAY